MKRTRLVLLLVIGMLAALLPVGAVGAADGVCDEPYTPIYDIQGDGFTSPLLPSPVQFLSYEGSFTADGGVADGMMSEDIGVSESSSTPVGYSLQLTGTGSTYSDFTWASAATNTFGAVNTGQTFSGSGDMPFINEIHYDNTSTDVGEAIEIAGPAGFDLSGWSIVLYNGSNQETYRTTSLSGTIPDLQNGFGAVVVTYPTNGIQNGSPDGVALVTSALVTTQGVVTADFQQSNELSGFFVQDLKGDKDSSTSDGVFVYHRDYWDYDVEVGQVVRFTAEVEERFGQTQLDNVEDLVVCGTGNVNATKVLLPVGDLADWETVEGMLVDMPQELHVSGNYTQARYGEVDLSFNWPLDNPTNVVAPGPEAIALQDINDRSRIQLEDGSRWSNLDSLPYFYDDPDYLTLRTGDTTKKKLTGVIAYDFGAYELHPTVPVEFQRKNPRPEGPPDVKGDLTVASFNVLNFFTHLDDGSNDNCGPTRDRECRGADSTTEYERQLAKIVAGIVGSGADVVGLQEIENDIYDDETGIPADRAHNPVLTLVEALNVVEGAGTWVWGGEANYYNDYPVRNEIIYRSASVTPTSSPVALESEAFDQTRDRFPGDIEPVGRPPLAQTFEENATGEEFTVVVNHFKSKGSGCDTLEYDGVFDVDAGDGQANCNLTRVAQSEALAAFVVDLASADPDVLVIGDLNSYAMEDPISTLKSAGFTNLIEKFVGIGWKAGAYSYNFFSQSGYLDHALATPSMTKQVVGTAVWHINADEPSGLDYNTYNQDALYSSDEFRASDHDPVLVGLRLK